MVRYESVTNISEVKNYIGNSKIVSFDFETSPYIKYRNEEKAALDAHKSNITGVSLSVSEGTAIYIPFNHKIGKNAWNQRDIIEWLKNNVFESKEVIKVAHNLAFESMYLYRLKIVVQSPVYDTIAAAQLTLKTVTEFRNLGDCGLKTLVPYLFGVDMPSYEMVTNGRHFDELDPQDEATINYACSDSDYTLRLYYRLNEWFDRNLPKHRQIAEQIESPTAVYTGIMKYNGLPVDKELMLSKQAEAAIILTRLKDEISFIIGGVDIGANASARNGDGEVFVQ